MNGVNGLKIGDYIRKNRLTQDEFSKIAGLSKPTINKVINRNTCDIKTLIAIANAMNVSLDYLCDRENVKVSVNGDKNQVGNGNVIIESQAHEIEYLKQLIEEKESMIQEKERTIQLLINKNK